MTQVGTVVANEGELRTGAAAPEIAALVGRVRAGDVRALSRAISLVEDGSAAARSILSACFPLTGAALKIGITGSPGAGKSTLVDQLTRALRAAGHAVGILAVDPTSPYTGGAILGDRIRMERHHADPGVYTRSMATRGALGGLARTAADVTTVMEASGKERILIETVGVGQDEIDIVHLADVTLVVLVPGMGDDVQSIKAGILEIADIFVINKSDREGADRVEKELRAMQSLASGHGSWVPPIVRTVGSTGEGVEALLDQLASFQGWLARDGNLRARRENHWRLRLLAMLKSELLRGVQEHGLGEKELAELARSVEAREQDPFATVTSRVDAMLARA